MKFTGILLFGISIVIVESKRTYTTPSPYGSYRVKQFKCSCNNNFFKYVYRNLSCFAKAIDRDTSTLNGYIKMRRNIEKFWFTTHIEYKYGTVYRTVMNFPQKLEFCHMLTHFNEQSHPLLKVLYKYFLILSDVHPLLNRLLKYGCPFKAGEEIGLFNLTVDPKYIPSVINQGDYRATFEVFINQIDNDVCNDTLILNIVSPIKESFG